MSKHHVMVEVEASEVLSELSDEEVFAEAQSRACSGVVSRVPIVSELFEAIGRQDKVSALGLAARVFTLPVEADAADAAIRRIMA